MKKNFCYVTIYKKDKKGVLPQIIFKNKPKNQTIIGAHGEPLTYRKHEKAFDFKVTPDQAYDDLKACNFNTLLQTCSLLNFEPNEVTYEMLEKTSKRGLNFLIRDQEIVGEKDYITDKNQEELVDYFTKNYLPHS